MSLILKFENPDQESDPDSKILHQKRSGSLKNDSGHLFFSVSSVFDLGKNRCWNLIVRFGSQQSEMIGVTFFRLRLLSCSTVEIRQSCNVYEQAWEGLYIAVVKNVFGLSSGWYLTENCTPHTKHKVFWVSQFFMFQTSLQKMHVTVIVDLPEWHKEREPIKSLSNRSTVPQCSRFLLHRNFTLCMIIPHTRHDPIKICSKWSQGVGDKVSICSTKISITQTYFSRGIPDFFFDCCFHFNSHLMVVVVFIILQCLSTHPPTCLSVLQTFRIKVLCSAISSKVLKTVRKVIVFKEHGNTQTFSNLLVLQCMICWKSRPPHKVFFVHWPRHVAKIIFPIFHSPILLVCSEELKND